MAREAKLHTTGLFSVYNALAACAVGISQGGTGRNRVLALGPVFPAGSKVKWARFCCYCGLCSHAGWSENILAAQEFGRSDHPAFAAVTATGPSGRWWGSWVWNMPIWSLLRPTTPALKIRRCYRRYRSRNQRQRLPRSVADHRSPSSDRCNTEACTGDGAYCERA